MSRLACADVVVVAVAQKQNQSKGIEVLDAAPLA
jgi:hypothetical protein